MSRSKNAPVSASFPLPVALQVGANEVGRRMAAMKTMTDDEEAALWQQLERRHAAQTRGLIAYRTGARTKRPRRQSRPSPTPNHQFCPSMSTHAARDERLCPGSVKALQVIYAECAGKEWRLITNGYLGEKIGRSARQVQRYISELREFGYIEVHRVLNDIGAEVGREIKPRKLCHPRYAERRRENTKNGGNAATTDLSPIKTKKIDSISEPDDCERNNSKKKSQGGSFLHCAAGFAGQR